MEEKELNRTQRAGKPKKGKKRNCVQLCFSRSSTWFLRKAFKVCSDTCNGFSYPFTGAAGSECREAVLLTRKCHHAFGSFSFCLESREKLL